MKIILILLLLITVIIPFFLSGWYTNESSSLGRFFIFIGIMLSFGIAGICFSKLMKPKNEI